jgi:HK97 gp10 family phage protein
MAKASYADFRMQWQGADAHALADYFDELTDKLQRKIARKMVRAGGTVVAKYMREEIKSLDMPYSRARNRKSRAKAKAKNQKPLFKTIGQKPYKVPLKGIIGTRVGPRHPEGAHGIIVDVGGNHPWGRTKAHKFMEKARKKAQAKAEWAQAQKLKQALAAERGALNRQNIARANRLSARPF